MKKYLTFAIALCIILSVKVQAQDSSSEKKDSTKSLYITKHMNYLIEDGGVWEAVNPGYKKDEQYSAKTFKYVIKKGIHGEQYRIKILSDVNNVGWWTSWDGYYLWDPNKRSPIYHSLSSNGAIANGTLSISKEGWLVNIFEIVSYSGERSTHKDINIKVNENEMHSEGYNLDKKGNWILDQKYIWKRVTEES